MIAVTAAKPAKVAADIGSPTAVPRPGSARRGSQRGNGHQRGHGRGCLDDLLSSTLLRQHSIA